VRASRVVMRPKTTITAHLIVGEKPEPFLAAALEGIAGVCDCAIINDNSGSPRSENSAIAAQSRLSQTGRLAFVRTKFTDFATARNDCIDATPAEFRHGWALFVDADEVHGDELAAMAALLPRLPENVSAVDGYSRHFVGSFRWWISIERRLRFFRFTSNCRWRGSVHEQLQPVGDAVVLPAVWSHYGHVVTPRAEAEKSRLYALLGGGDAPSEDVLSIVTPAMVWPRLLRRANRFHGSHPLAVVDTIAALETERASIYAEVDEIVSRQGVADRARNAAYRMNIARLLFWRQLGARIRWGWPAGRTPLERLGYAGSVARGD